MGVVVTADGLTKTMGGKVGGSLGVGGKWALTEEGVLDEKVISDREPRVFGRFTNPAALIFGPRRKRASMAPSECLTTWERVREARPLRDWGEHSEVEDVGGEGWDEGMDEAGDKRWSAS